LADFADAIAPFGSKEARASADLIVGTLGMPPNRARLASLAAVQAPVSVPDLDVARTLAMTPGAAINQTPSGQSVPPWGAGSASSGLSVSAPATAPAPSKGSSSLVIGALVGFLAIGAVGAVGAGVAVWKRRDAHSEPAAASAVAAANSAGATPVEAPPASVASGVEAAPSASAVTADSPVASASVDPPPTATKAAQTKRGGGSTRPAATTTTATNNTTAAAASAAVAPTASAKSKFATSSKD
jgi:hypothetical protein